MVKKIFTFGLLIIAAATVLVTPGTGQAQGIPAATVAYQPYTIPRSYYSRTTVTRRLYQPYYGYPMSIDRITAATTATGYYGIYPRTGIPDTAIYSALNAKCNEAELSDS